MVVTAFGFCVGRLIELNKAKPHEFESLNDREKERKKIRINLFTHTVLLLSFEYIFISRFGLNSATVLLSVQIILGAIGYVLTYMFPKYLTAFENRR
jgi:hypothetical protein